MALCKTRISSEMPQSCTKPLIIEPEGTRIGPMLPFGAIGWFCKARDLMTNKDIILVPGCAGSDFKVQYCLHYNRILNIITCLAHCGLVLPYGIMTYLCHH